MEKVYLRLAYVMHAHRAFDLRMSDVHNDALDAIFDAVG